MQLIVFTERFVLLNEQSKLDFVLFAVALVNPIFDQG